MNGRLRIALLAFAAGLTLLTTLAAQGPDGSGARLFNPLADPTPRPTQGSSGQPASLPPAGNLTTPAYLKPLFEGVQPVSAQTFDPNMRRGLGLPDETADINLDIQTTPVAGNWMIYVISYPGAEGPALARKMVQELRTKNRVPAYVYYFGAEEKRKEYERVKKIVDQQKEFFKQNNMTPDQPLRIRHQNIDVHHAVLMGGYPDQDSAKRALEQVRRWEKPDPKSVSLETMFYQTTDPKKQDKVDRTELKYINPFQRAFVCRNPTVKEEKQEQKIDVAKLRRMNVDEPYSLFTCRKAYTLAVKEFQTPYMMQDRVTSAGAWDVLGGSGKADRVDGAAISAHNLAETLRKLKLEAFVLHSTFSSTVTIGSYDGVDDPSLKSMQEMLAQRFSQQPFTQIQFFHRPVTMPVPK